MEKTILEQIKEVINIDNRVAEIVRKEEKVFLQCARAGYSDFHFTIGEHIENDDVFDVYLEKVKELLEEKGYKVYPAPEKDRPFIDFVIKPS